MSTRRAWLPPPAPETAVQLALAARSLGPRVRSALTAAAIMLVVIAVLVLGVFPHVSLPAHIDSERRRGLLFQLAIGVIVIALTHRLAGLRHVGLQWRGATTSLVLALPLLAMVLVEHPPARLPALGPLVSASVLSLAVGFNEEVYGRGLVVTLLGGRRHAALAAVGSAVLFAYLHMPIYIVRHGLHQAFVRSTASAAFSVAFALIRLRSGSLAGPILFHAVNDAQFLIDDPGTTGATPASMGIRPMVVGAIVSVVYWLACRRAIAEAAERDGARSVVRSGALSDT